jgi:hypothetical protein
MPGSISKYQFEEREFPPNFLIPASCVIKYYSMHPKLPKYISYNSSPNTNWNYPITGLNICPGWVITKC